MNALSPELQKRIVSGIVMLTVTLSVIMHFGHFAHLFLIFVVQAKAFHELKEIGLTSQLGRNQVIVDWLLFTVVNETMRATVMNQKNCLNLYPFISYVIVTVYWMTQVLNKHKDKLKESILHYSWIHLVLFFTAPQTLFISLNLKLGLFWFIFPCLAVIINDSSAYFIGRSFGKRQLISLSPNKTIEGFVGAAVSTISIGYLLVLFLSQYDSLFENTNYIIRNNIGYHGFVIAIFASFLAPVGDLVGSAIKRAGKVKDFDSLIPGHGGISDRVDGHLFMAVFTYLYYQSVLQNI